MPATAWTEVISPGEFFAIEGAPRWWKFRDVASGKPGMVESSQPTPDRILVKLDLAAEKGELEWHIEKVEDPDNPGQMRSIYNLVKSTRPGAVFTWNNMLRIPYAWKVGDAAHAVSQEGNPVTGNRVDLTVTLAAYGTKVPSPGWGPLFPANHQIGGWIQVSQAAKDVGLGAVLARMTTTYVLGLGIVHAQGDYFGKFYVMQLERHS